MSAQLFQVIRTYRILDQLARCELNSLVALGQRGAVSSFSVHAGVSTFPLFLFTRPRKVERCE